MVKLGFMVKTYFVSNNVENILIQFAVHIEAIKILSSTLEINAFSLN